MPQTAQYHDASGKVVAEFDIPDGLTEEDKVALAHALDQRYNGQSLIPGASAPPQANISEQATNAAFNDIAIPTVNAAGQAASSVAWGGPKALQGVAQMGAGALGAFEGALASGNPSLDALTAGAVKGASLVPNVADYAPDFLQEREPKTELERIVRTVANNVGGALTMNSLGTVMQTLKGIDTLTNDQLGYLRYAAGLIGRETASGVAEETAGALTRDPLTGEENQWARIAGALAGQVGTSGLISLITGLQRARAQSPMNVLTESPEMTVGGRMGAIIPPENVPLAESELAKLNTVRENVAGFQGTGGALAVPGMLEIQQGVAAVRPGVARAIAERSASDTSAITRGWDEVKNMGGPEANPEAFTVVANKRVRDQIAKVQGTIDEAARVMASHKQNEVGAQIRSDIDRLKADFGNKKNGLYNQLPLDDVVLKADELNQQADEIARAFVENNVPQQINFAQRLGGLTEEGSGAVESAANRDAALAKMGYTPAAGTGGGEEKVMTLRQLKDLRWDVLNQLRELPDNAMNAPIRAKLEKMETYIEGMYDKIGEHIHPSSTLDPTQAGQVVADMRAINKWFKPLSQSTRSKNIANLFALGPQGELRVADENIIPTLLRDSKNTQQFRTLVDRFAKEDPETAGRLLKVARDGVMRHFFESVIPDPTTGVIKKGAADAYIRKYGPSINLIDPSLRDKFLAIDETGRIEEALRKQVSKYANAKAYGINAYDLLADSTSASDQANAILSSSTPRAAALIAMKIAGDDPHAQAGMRAAFFDALNALVKKKAGDFAQTEIYDSQALGQALDKYKDALKVMGYNEQHLKTLQYLEDAAEYVERGSGTPNLKIESPEKQLQAFTAFAVRLISDYRSYRRGVVGAGWIPASEGARQLAQLISDTGKEDMAKIQQEIILNPEFGLRIRRVAEQKMNDGATWGKVKSRLRQLGITSSVVARNRGTNEEQAGPE